VRLLSGPDSSNAAHPETLPGDGASAAVDGLASNIVSATGHRRCHLYRLANSVGNPINAQSPTSDSALVQLTSVGLRSHGPPSSPEHGRVSRAECRGQGWPHRNVWIASDGKGERRRRIEFPESSNPALAAGSIWHRPANEVGRGSQHSVSAMPRRPVRQNGQSAQG